MSIKLPVISQENTIKAFEKIGYEAVRQKGSHTRLRDDINQFHEPITISDHKST